MFHKNIINTRVILNPDEIRRKAVHRNVDKSLLINHILLHKIKDLYGDKCIEKGYVQGSTIEIVERSIGKIYAEHLNGNIIYDVRFSADICNPIKGEIVNGRVTNSNKMGLLVKAGPLNIVLARQHHVNRKCFKKINVGDEIPVSIVGSRFTLNDREISVIGYLGDVPQYIDEDDVEFDDDETSSVMTSITEEVDDDTESVASELF